MMANAKWENDDDKHVFADNESYTREWAQSVLKIEVYLPFH